jgi:hypothetical protein
MASLFRNNVEIYSPRGELRRRFSVPFMRTPAVSPPPAAIPSETFFRKVVVERGGALLLLGGTMSPRGGMSSRTGGMGDISVRTSFRKKPG